MPHANVVIPVKGYRTGKSRLSAALDGEERLALVRDLVKRTIGCAYAAVGPHAVYLLSPDGGLLATAVRCGVNGMLQHSAGLNEGLEEIRHRLPPVRTLVVPADIPALTAADIRAHADIGGVGLSPDRHRLGTNLLSVPTPDAIPFRFGYDSFRAHRRAAARAGLPVTVIASHGIAHDLDRPWDLRRLWRRFARTVR